MRKNAWKIGIFGKNFKKKHRTVIVKKMPTYKIRLSKELEKNSWENVILSTESKTYFEFIGKSIAERLFGNKS